MTKTPQKKAPQKKPAGKKPEKKSATASQARPKTGADTAASGKPAVKTPETKPEAKPAAAKSVDAAAKSAPKPSSPAAKDPAAKSSAADAASGSSFLRGAAIAAAMLIVAAVAVALTAKDWWPKIEPYVSANDGDASAARMAALESRLDAIEAAAAADALADLQAARAQLAEQISGVLRRLDEAEQALGALKSVAESVTSGDPAGAAASNGVSPEVIMQRLEQLEAVGRETVRASARDAAALAALSERVESLAAERASRVVGDIVAQATVLAVGQLRGAVDGGGAFENELSVLAGAAGDDAAIVAAVEALKPLAPTGVPTVGDLQRRFEALAGDIVRADQAVEGDDWVSQTINRLQSLVTVRRIAGGDAADVDGRVAEAERLLRANDLAGAVAAVAAIEGAAAEAARPWLRAAENRLAAAAALDTLHAEAIRRLADGRG